MSENVLNFRKYTLKYKCLGEKEHDICNLCNLGKYHMTIIFFYSSCNFSINFNLVLNESLKYQKKKKTKKKKEKKKSNVQPWDISFKIRFAYAFYFMMSIFQDRRHHFPD